jgi:hypothetical protein
VTIETLSGGADLARRRVPLASSAALIAANMVPIWGVLFAGWSVLAIMVLFWVENLVVGGFNVLKMATVRVPGQFGIAAKAFMIPFFTLHYGIFCLVHGVFVFALFGGALFANHGAPGVAAMNPFVAGLETLRHLWLPILALVASHGVSFYMNFIRGGEWRTTELPVLMAQPYGRIVLLHVTILLGGVLVAITGSGTAALLLLTALKTVTDLAAHLKQNGGFKMGDLAADLAARRAVQRG